MVAIIAVGIFLTSLFFCLFVCFLQLLVHSKTEQDAQASLPITSMYALSPPLSKSPTTVVHLLQSVNLH